VIAFERPRRFAYTLLSGLPVRDHVATVDLEPADGATRLTYAVRTMPTLPLGGRAVVAAARQGIKVLLSGVAGEAERRAGGA
jgi:hypothetical protein